MSNRGSIYKCITIMDVDICNIGSMNIDFVEYQSRDTIGKASALRGAKTLYGTLYNTDYSFYFLAYVR